MVKKNIDLFPASIPSTCTCTINFHAFMYLNTFYEYFLFKYYLTCKNSDFFYEALVRTTKMPKKPSLHHRTNDAEDLQLLYVVLVKDVIDHEVYMHYLHRQNMTHV